MTFAVPAVTRFPTFAVPVTFAVPAVTRLAPDTFPVTVKVLLVLLNTKPAEAPTNDSSLN